MAGSYGAAHVAGQAWPRAQATNITRREKRCRSQFLSAIIRSIFVVASTDVPNRVNEYDYAGGITGQPLNVVDGPLDGIADPRRLRDRHRRRSVAQRFMPEGPFGEWTGYYASNQPAVPVIRVKAVYHRNDPILCGFPLLKPSSGDNLHFSLMRSALIWNALDEAGVPDVQASGAIHPAAAS